MNIVVSADDRNIRRKLRQLQSKVGDLTPVMSDIGELIKLSVKRNFEAGGRPTPWKKSQRAQADGGLTLSDKGTLRNSFTTEAKPSRVTVGTTVKYAAIHHFGGIIKPRSGSGKKALNTPYGPRRSITMPQRPFLMLQDEDRRNILRLVQTYLED